MRGLLTAALLSALCLAVTSCGDSTASSSSEATGGGGITTSSYPAAVAKRFVKSCAVNAKLTSSGALSSDQAKEICVDALTCLEQNLTISEFREAERKLLTGQANPGAKFFRSCTEEAIEQSLG
jgi:hypothetical protein